MHSAAIGFQWHLATAAGLRVTTEKGVGGPERPGDLSISFWQGAGPLAVDGVIVHPLMHPLNPSTPYTAVKSGLEAAAEEEQRKRVKHGPSCAAANVAFEPFSMSSFGQLGASARSMFSDLVALVPEVGSKDEKKERIRHYDQQLQLALKRDIARMLLQGSHIEIPKTPPVNLSRPEALRSASDSAMDTNLDAPRQSPAPSSGAQLCDAPMSESFDGFSGEVVDEDVGEADNFPAASEKSPKMAHGSSFTHDPYRMWVPGDDTGGAQPLSLPNWSRPQAGERQLV